MRAVLYTHDMIPITVLDVPPMYHAYLQENRQLILAIRPDFKFTDHEDAIAMHISLRTVTITAEWFHRRGERHLMLFTQDEESALLLQASFLPGQTREVREREQKAFAAGFFKALIG